MRIATLILVLTLAFTTTSVEAKKVALIIGNSDYLITSPLANPVNDAELVAQSAISAGFEVVTVANDLEIGGFQKVLRDFRYSADGADVAMVYYAGHGIEGQGKNWLIPVDAELGGARDLPYEAIELDRVLETIEGARMRIVVLDACRNNPFARTWKSKTRAVASGLAGLEVDDFLVIYAAAPGQTAVDGKGNNSPFAVSLANRLPQPDLPVQLLGGMVRDDVLKATDGEQRPFVSASVTGTPIYLVPRQEAPKAAIVQSPGIDLEAIEDLAWKGAIASDDVNALRSYLSQFPQGKYATAANRKISETSVPETVKADVDQNVSVGLGVVKSYILSDITIESIKLTGFLGLPDQVFLSFEGGARFPERGTKPRTMKKGESWEIAESFALDDLAGFRVMEHDPIGGHDVIGSIMLGKESGTFTQTLNGDRSEYRITYKLTKHD